MRSAAELTVAVCLWGWSFLATKVLLESLDPMEVVGARLLVGLPVMAWLAWRHRDAAPFSGAERWRLGICAALLLVHFPLQAWALERTTATQTSWLIALTPLVIAAVAAAQLGERLRALQWAGVGIATLGVLVLVSRAGSTPLASPQTAGDWAIVVSTFTWAAYTATGRDVGRRHGPSRVVAVILGVAALALTPFLLFGDGWRHIAALPARGWLAALFLGILAQALAFILWQRGTARIGASRAGLFLYLEPLATTAVAVPLFGEPFGPWMALGGALILCGVALGEGRGRAPTAIG